MNWIGFLVSVVAAWFVHSDADKLRQQGARVTPWLWAIVVLLFVLVPLPIYLILRVTTWRKQIELAKGLTPSPMTARQIVFVILLLGAFLLVVIGILATIVEGWMS